MRLHEEYDIEGEHYLQYFNRREGSTMDGNYYDLSELHKYVECGDMFWFLNSAY
jgi:hypothetical protein